MYIGPSVINDANCEGFPICDDRITENDRCVIKIIGIPCTFPTICFNYNMGSIILIFLFAGDNESGKTTMVAKLQGVEEPRKGSGLEYYYMDVTDEYRDGMFFFAGLQSNSGLWIDDVRLSVCQHFS